MTLNATSQLRITWTISTQLTTHSSMINISRTAISMVSPRRCRHVL
jgi:hypothetical protein